MRVVERKGVVEPGQVEVVGVKLSLDRIFRAELSYWFPTSWRSLAVIGIEVRFERLNQTMATVGILRKRSPFLNIVGCARGWRMKLKDRRVAMKGFAQWIGETD